MFIIKSNSVALTVSIKPPGLIKLEKYISRAKFRTNLFGAIIKKWSKDSDRINFQFSDYIKDNKIEVRYVVVRNR